MSKTNLYQVGNNTIMSRGWTWAYGVTDLYENAVPCDVCGKGELFPGYYPEFSMVAEVEGGTKYPDVLGCGAYPLFIVSDYVVRDWETNGIRGYEKFAVTVGSAKGKKIKELKPPQYYHIKVTGRCQLNMKAMGNRIVEHCPKCLYTRADPLNYSRYVIDFDSWDGSDLFVSEYLPFVTFCSQSVLDLASVNRRTNFCFTIPELPWDSQLRGVKYL